MNKVKVVHAPVDYKKLIDDTEKCLLNYPENCKEREKVTKFLETIKQKAKS